MSPKIKRVVALLGVVILVGLYLITLILAFVDPTASKDWLKASIICTIIIPVFSEKIKGRQNMQADGIPRRFRAGIPPAFTVFIYCSSFTVLHLRVSYYYSVFAGRLSDHAPVPSHLSQCQIGRRRESYRQELRFL